MRTVELIIHVGEDLQEFLIAELADLDFQGFVCEDEAVRAYLPAPRWDDVRREHIEQWLRARGLYAALEERVLEPQNWNARWEETIRPLAVGPFLIKPTWAEVPAEHAEKLLLEIDPKMSFGTGYHESTRLALRFLPGLVKGGERVLDAGTGTGILAIAAARLGAASALAFDTSAWAQQNAVENLYLNQVAGQVVFRAGSIEAVPEAGFDLILANINRDVLLEMLPAFSAKARPGGRLVLSGLLETDRPTILAAAEAHGFTLLREAREAEWWAVVFEKAERPDVS